MVPDPGHQNYCKYPSRPQKNLQAYYTVFQLSKTNAHLILILDTHITLYFILGLLMLTLTRHMLAVIHHS